MILTLTGLALAGVHAHAADAAHGGEIHAKDCDGCHAGRMDGDGSKMYTRPNRRVDSLTRLEGMVRMCDANLGLKMFDDDIHDVVEYLNQNHYKFSSK